MLADGPSIKQYVADTAAEHGVAEHIRFGRRGRQGQLVDRGRPLDASRSTPRAAARSTPASSSSAATGYYNYDEGYRPVFPGEEDFCGAGGQIVHPQFWPEDLDYAGKRVVIIGSGATAITLVPAMATGDGAAGHVTMLQRSPTYIMPVPEQRPGGLAAGEAPGARAA